MSTVFRTPGMASWVGLRPSSWKTWTTRWRPRPSASSPPPSPFAARPRGTSSTFPTDGSLKCKDFPKKTNKTKSRYLAVVRNQWKTLKIYCHLVFISEEKKELQNHQLLNANSSPFYESVVSLSSPFERSWYWYHSIFTLKQTLILTKVHDNDNHISMQGLGKLSLANMESIKLCTKISIYTI